MKIWHGYGSEHSTNLVMVGHFKSPDDAEKTQKLIDQLTDELKDKIDIGSSQERFGDEVREILLRTDCYNLNPLELEQFLYDVGSRVEGNRIILTTEESEVSAFFKVMIKKGAKVEIFSAHDYPDVEDKPGK